MQGACHWWDVQPSPALSARIATKAQLVPGFAVDKGIVGA